MSDRAWRVPWPDRFGAWWQQRFPALGPWLADLESRFAAYDCDLDQVDRPVFICGLARSGSTMLLEWLHGTPGFTAHRYADFPLLWTPYWWNSLLVRLPKAAAQPVERAHRDRILVTRASPEAFEELLWAHHFPVRAGSDDVLDERADVTTFAPRFRAHIAKLLAARGARRYVSKGNYNTLRLRLLAHLFKDARFVVPIREPLSQVASALRQDALYAGAPTATLAQIAARGHHEFGPRKRPVRVSPAHGAAIEALWREGRVADGWLQQWIDVYQHVAEVLQARPDLAERITIVPFERLCAQARRELQRIAGNLELGLDAVALDAWAERFSAPTHDSAAMVPAPADARVNQAQAIYRSLYAHRFDSRAAQPG